MANKAHVFISCQMAVHEAITKQPAFIPVSGLASLAAAYGKNFGVTEEEAIKMLKQPLCDIAGCKEIDE